MSTTVRVRYRTRQRVAAMAATTGQQMQTIIGQAGAAYERELFWRGFEEGYDRLATDSLAWDELGAERSAEAGGAAGCPPTSSSRPAAPVCARQATRRSRT